MNYRKGTAPMARRQHGSNPRAMGSNPRSVAQLSLVEDDYRAPVALQTPCQRLVAAAVDHCRSHNVPISKRTIGQLAKSTKSLLEDGFPETTVYQAALMAVATNEPHRHDSLAQGLALAGAGLLMDRRTASKRMQDEAEIAAARQRWTR